MSDARRSWKVPLLVATLTTALVTALSYGLPDAYAATGVGLAFLAVTYAVALRQRAPDPPAHYGLALGGLLEPEPLSSAPLKISLPRRPMWS